MEEQSECCLILRDALFEIPNVPLASNIVAKHKYVNYLGQNYFHIEYGLEQYSYVKYSDPLVLKTLFDALSDKRKFSFDPSSDGAVQQQEGHFLPLESYLRLMHQYAQIQFKSFFIQLYELYIYQGKQFRTANQGNKPPSQSAISSQPAKPALPTQFPAQSHSSTLSQSPSSPTTAQSRTGSSQQQQQLSSAMSSYEAFYGSSSPTASQDAWNQYYRAYYPNLSYYPNLGFATPSATIETNSPTQFPATTATISSSLARVSNAQGVSLTSALASPTTIPTSSTTATATITAKQPSQAPPTVLSLATRVNPTVSPPTTTSPNPIPLRTSPNATTSLTTTTQSNSTTNQTNAASNRSNSALNQTSVALPASPVSVPPSQSPSVANSPISVSSQSASPSTSPLQQQHPSRQAIQPNPNLPPPVNLNSPSTIANPAIAPTLPTNLAPVDANASVANTTASTPTPTPTTTPTAAAQMLALIPENIQQALMQLLSSIPALNGLAAQQPQQQQQQQQGAPQPAFINPAIPTFPSPMPMPSPSPLPRRGGSRHPPHVVERLRLWFDTKTRNPVREDREMISQETGLESIQIEAWFAIQRKKLRDLEKKAAENPAINNSDSAATVFARNLKNLNPNSIATTTNPTLPPANSNSSTATNPISSPASIPTASASSLLLSSPSNAGLAPNANAAISNAGVTRTSDNDESLPEHALPQLKTLPNVPRSSRESASALSVTTAAKFATPNGVPTRNKNNSDASNNDNNSSSNNNNSPSSNNNSNSAANPSAPRPTTSAVLDLKKRLHESRLAPISPLPGATPFAHPFSSTSTSTMASPVSFGNSASNPAITNAANSMKIVSKDTRENEKKNEADANSNEIHMIIDDDDTSSFLALPTATQSSPKKSGPVIDLDEINVKKRGRPRKTEAVGANRKKAKKTEGLASREAKHLEEERATHERREQSRAREKSLREKEARRLEEERLAKKSWEALEKKLEARLAVMESEESESDDGETLPSFEKIYFTKSYLKRLDNGLRRSDYEMVCDLPDSFSDSELREIGTLTELRKKRKKLEKLLNKVEELEAAEKGDSDKPKKRRGRKPNLVPAVGKATTPKKAKPPKKKATSASINDVKILEKQELNKLTIEQREETMRLLQYDRFVRQYQVNVAQMQLYLKSANAALLPEKERQKLQQQYNDESTRHAWYLQDYSRVYMQCQLNHNVRDRRIVELKRAIEASSPKSKPKAHPLLAGAIRIDAVPSESVESTATATEERSEVASNKKISVPVETEVSIATQIEREEQAGELAKKKYIHDGLMQVFKRLCEIGEDINDEYNFPFNALRTVLDTRNDLDIYEFKDIFRIYCAETKVVKCPRNDIATLFEIDGLTEMLKWSHLVFKVPNCCQCASAVQDDVVLCECCGDRSHNHCAGEIHSGTWFCDACKNLLPEYAKLRPSAEISNQFNDYMLKKIQDGIQIEMRRRQSQDL